MNHPFWLRFPDRCCATVTRKGEEEACEKPAVAVAIYDGPEYEWHAYPVCKHHSRGRPMMPLDRVISTATWLPGREYEGREK